jgi:serine/threonine-protein kinase
MAKDPEQRFRSARSFARELRQWIDENPATPESERTVPVAEPKQQPRVAVTIAAAAAAVVVLGAATTWALMSRWSSEGSVPVAGARAQPAPQAAAPAQPPAVDPAVAAATVEQARSAPTPPTADAAVVAVAANEAGTPATGAAPPTQGAAGVRPGAPVATPGKPAAAATNAGTAATPPAASKETPKDRRAREAREREARESEARAAAVNRIAAPATGTVRIAISPWGLVEVDGTSSGAAPPITELTLAEGKHQIVVRNGDYPPYTTQVHVTAGQTVTLRHKFGS